MAHNGRQKADEALALALAGGQTLRNAAQTVRVSERTATRRWADPGFRVRVSELRGEMVGTALGRMVDGMTEAAGVLRKLLASERESIRLAAARSLLELGVKLRASVEIEQRLAELERRQVEAENRAKE